MPRLYREAPLNSIWEGSGNVNALDVLRALAKTARGLRGLLRRGRRSPPAPTPRLDAFVAGLRDEFADLEAIEMRARRIVEKLALALQGSLLVRNAPPRGRRRVLRLAPGRRRRPGLRHAARRRRRPRDRRPAHPAL